LTLQLAAFHPRARITEISCGSTPMTQRRAESLAGVLAALGHPLRLRILERLMTGPATYEELVKLTGVRSGPLYFHLEQLRSVMLVGPKRRDCYELTRHGTAYALIAGVLGRMRA